MEEGPGLIAGTRLTEQTFLNMYFPTHKNVTFQLTLVDRGSGIV